MKPRVCLVNPRQIGPYPALGLGYIAAYAKKYGKQDYEIRIIDGNVTENILSEVKDFDPQIVGFTSLSTQICKAVELSFGIRSLKKNILQLIGGVHVNADTKNTLLRGSFDVAVLGEGEVTFLEVIEKYFIRGKLSLEDLQKINGIAFLDEDKVVYTKARGQIQDLDRIPFPSRELFDMEYYLGVSFGIRGMVGQRVATMMSSRGCPYKCIFCCSGIVFTQVREFSPEYMVREIEELVHRYRVKMIYFCNDMFFISKSRVRDFCQLIIRKKLDRKIKWSVQARANLIHEDDCELLKLMRRAGCVQIEFGFESGSDKILALLKEKLVTVADNQRAVDVAKKAGLRVLGTFMVGTPGETRDDLSQTSSFINRNIKKMDYFQTFLTTPFPGTRLYAICKERNLIGDDYFAEEKKRAQVQGRFIYNDAMPSRETLKAYDYLDFLGLKKVSLKYKLKWVFYQIFNNLFKKGNYALGERLRLYFKMTLLFRNLKEKPHEDTHSKPALPN